MGFLNDLIGSSTGPAIIYDPVWDKIGGKDFSTKALKDASDQASRFISHALPESWLQFWDDTAIGEKKALSILDDETGSRSNEIMVETIGDKTVPDIIAGPPSPLPTIFPLTAASGRLASSLSKQRERAQTKFSGGLDGGGNQPLSLFNI